MARDGEGAVAVDVDVAAGQRRAARPAEPVRAEAKAAAGAGDEVPADEGPDADSVRGPILDEPGARPVIPNRRDRQAPRPGDDARAGASGDRNRAGRGCGEAEQPRALAARDDELEDVDLGPVRLVFGFINARRLARTVNRP